MTAPGAATAPQAGPPDPPSAEPTAPAPAAGSVAPADVKPAGPGDTEPAGSVARNSATMALGSLVSRATGFLRTTAIGAAIGAVAVGDSYTVANTLPNLVYELLVGGVLTSVIVPVLVRVRKSEPDRGEAYVQRLLTLGTLFFGVATVLAVASAPLLTALITNRDTPAADRQLTTTLAYLLLPEIFFYGMAALIAAVLNSRGHFAAPMWTPILNNIVVISTAVVFALLPFTGELTPESITQTQVLVLGIGTTLGIVVQATGLWPALRRTGFRWRWRWDLRQLRLGELARLGSWLLLYVGVSQVGVMVVLKIATWAGDRGGPGPAVFNTGFLVFMMAHGIVAVSIITALLPRMSAAVADGRPGELAAHLSLGTRMSAVILLPAAAGYVVLGQPIVVTLFEYGEFEHSEAVATGWVIAVTGLALIPYVISQIQIFVYYALSDTKLPALINIPVVALRIAIDVALFLVLPAAWVAVGLMAGSTVSFVVGALLGYLLLRRRLGRLGLAATAGTLGRLSIAALVGGLGAFGVRLLAVQAWGEGHLSSLAQLVLGGAVLLGGYLGMALLLRIQEIRDLAVMLRTRLGR